MTIRSVAATAAPKPSPEPKMARACQDFEALFIKQLLLEMRRAGGSMMGTSLGAQVYQDLCDENLAQQLSRPPGIGIGRDLLQQLQRTSSPAGAADAEKKEGSACGTKSV